MIIVMGVEVVRQVEISRQNGLDFRDRTNRSGGENIFTKIGKN